MRSGWNPDHGRGVAGEYAGVAAEIAVARGAGGAQADPERQAGEEQHTLLGEQGDQSDHHAEADQGSDDAVEALGQDLPALRLHDDEDRHQHRAWLRQLQAIGQPQGEAGGEQGLEHEDQATPSLRAHSSRARRNSSGLGKNAREPVEPRGPFRVAQGTAANPERRRGRPKRLGI